MMLESLWHDMLYGARVLRRNPGFALVAILTLALGIGANTAIFSLVDAVLLRPLPYPHPDQLVVIWAEHEERKNEHMQLSYPDFGDLRAQASDFESAAALFSDRWELTGIPDSGAITGVLATPNFFRTLGVPPALGRTFAESEAEPGRDGVVVLGWRLWRQRLGGSTDIMGKSITLDGKPYTVVGVLPESFDFTLPVTSSFAISDVQAWRPLARDHFLAGSRNIFTYEVVARLKSGASLGEAQSQIAAIASRLESAYPATNRGRSFLLVPLHLQVVGEVRSGLVLLFCSTALVLLIAIVNLANLLLARGVSRAREVVVRAALGASRTRLLRQFLAENALLALVGCATGLLLAAWTRRVLIDWAASRIPLANSAALDGRVLTFAFAITFLAMLLFGLLPAWLFSGTHLETGGANAVRAFGGRRSQSAGHLLVVFEVALACLLLVGAGLLAESFRALLEVDPGFQTANVVSFELTSPADRYAHKAETLTFYQGLTTSLQSTPGVDSVALVSTVPLSGENTGSEAQVEGRPLALGEHGLPVGWQMVSPQYFQTLGIALIRGRYFRPADLQNSTHVTIINEKMARLLFADGDPIGRRILVGTLDPKSPDWHTVIGVVRDTRKLSLDTPAGAEAYDLFGQHWDRTMYVMVRAHRSVADVLALVRRDVASMDKQMPLDEVRTLSQYLSASLAPRRYVLSLVVAFAALAMILAALGTYGVLSYLVGRRTREIGIRVAVGAQRGQVLRAVVADAMKLAIAGVLCGVVGSLWLTRLLQSQLYGVNARDPKTLLAVALLLILVAVVASLIPARRAASVDPIAALREE